MLVVSDTSPLNYLLLVDAIEILPVLFSEFFILPAVLSELHDPRAPGVVREWVNNLPSWVKVQAPQHVKPIAALHRGETEAIALAEELHADAILIDERDASQEASQRGIAVVGTLAILSNAIVRGLLDQNIISTRLAQTNFRGPRELLDVLVELFKAHGEGGI